mmetsp:Transcript_38037/g.68215  ORF Transcript_38037/g.68215 Transcript_38037/m.68215 type:complete len:205 (+) Transcript_38037:1032-1646(+)
MWKRECHGPRRIEKPGGPATRQFPFPPVRPHPFYQRPNPQAGHPDMPLARPAGLQRCDAWRPLSQQLHGGRRLLRPSDPTLPPAFASAGRGPPLGLSGASPARGRRCNRCGPRRRKPYPARYCQGGGRPGPTASLRCCSLHSSDCTPFAVPTSPRGLRRRPRAPWQGDGQGRFSSTLTKPSLAPPSATCGEAPSLATPPPAVRQ